MELTIRNLFDWKNLREDVARHCRTCHKCQVSKKQKKKYGHLPPKIAEVIPWKRVNIDIVGPYTVRTPDKKKHVWQAMTMIDPATGWFEVAYIPNDPDSDDCQRIFDSYWLSRYPRPQEIGYDNASIFKRYFKEMIDNYGLTKKPSTEYNPQSNGMIKRVHQVLGNMMRTFELSNQDLEEENPWEPFLTAAAFAIRSTYHTTTGASPGQLVFGRDMMLPIQFKADWARIQQSKQERINDSNKQENSKWLAHKYHVGDEVLVNKPGIIPKMENPRTGPYRICDVHDNGTVTIQDGPVRQRINIWRLQPYHCC
jgi:hypothetical protein